MKKLMIAVAACAAFLPLCAAEEEPVAAEPAPVSEPEADDGEKGEFPLSIELKLDLMSAYMWRGMILDRRACYQPSVTVSYETEDFGTLALGYWTSLDLTHRRNSCGGGGNTRRFGSMIEQDISAVYSNSFDLGEELGALEYEFGIIAYDYPYNGKHHQGYAGSFCSDLYASVSWKNWLLTPGVEGYWSYGTAHDHDPSVAYFLFSLEHEFAFDAIEGLTITPKASLGVGDGAFVHENNGYVPGAHTQMTDQTLTLEAEYEVCEHFAIGANINYTWTPSHTLRHQRYMSCGDDSSHQLVWGGVSAKLTF